MKADDAKLNRWLKIAAITVLAFLALYLLADYVMPILGNILSVAFPLILPFILAIILAVLLSPVINWLQRKTRMKRGAAVGIVLVLALLAMTAVVVVIISQLIKEIYILAADFSDSSYGINIDAIMEYMESLYTSTALSSFVDPAVIQSGFNSLGVTLTNWITDFLYKLADFFKSTPGIFFMLLVAAFGTYYFCKDENMVVNFITRITPHKMEDAAKGTYLSMIDAFLGYVRAQLILITITAVISIIGFLILRTDYVIVMGLMVGFFDLLPVFGPGTVFVPWAAFSAINGDYFTAIGLMVIYVLVICIRHVIQPKLIADGIGLHPLATIASIYIGLKLLGVWGLIFGPIILVIVLGIIESYNLYKKRLSGDSSDTGFTVSGESRTQKNKKGIFKIFK
ncbi:MAG: sporulation integral membrane protein YtvI [Bacillota bacterium]|jgi:sporulation integral membrane protein YtvI